MNTGVILGVLSLFSMSLAPILNKFASGSTGWIWGAALNSSFCFLISVIVRPRTLRDRTAIFSMPILKIAATNSLGLLCQYAATVRLDPPTMSVLGRMYVVFAILLSHFVLKERQSRRDACVLGLVLTGALLFCWSENLNGDLAGVILCLSYCLFFAWTHLQIKRVTKSTSSNVILLANNLISTIFLLPMAFILEGALGKGCIYGVTLLFGSAFFGGWLGLLLFYEALKRIPMGQANFIRTFSPLVGVAVAWPFFPVHFTPTQLVGAGIMLSALALQAMASLRVARS